MKALIISEEQTVCDSLNAVLVKAGYDTIVYKWLLKALDNIEEIRPDCIVVSSSEYPRHWKTLVQFVKSGIGGDNVDIYLYEPNPMSAEDEEKARILGITDYFTTLENAELEKIFKPAGAAAPSGDTVPEPVAAPVAVDEAEEVPTVDNIAPQEETDAGVNNDHGHYMLTNPFTHKYLCGKFFEYNGKTLTCSISNISDLEGIFRDTNLDYFTFFDIYSTKTAAVIVKDIVKAGDNNNLLLVEIKTVYDEN